jgi:uncharacterized protein YegL
MFMSDGIYDDVKGITRKQMVLFFLIDTSSSMANSKISSVNTAIREVIPELRDIGGADVDLRIAVLEFSSGFQWQNPSGPVAVDKFSWSNLSADGVTDMGTAFLELNNKLSRNSFLKAPSASFAPVIILLSDGMPVDDWQSGLTALKADNWFKAAVKAALAIGSDAEFDVLSEFTGDTNTVIRVNNPGVLRTMIKKVSITSSQIGTRTQRLQGGEVESRQDELGKALEVMQEEPDFSADNAREEWF